MPSRGPVPTVPRPPTRALLGALALLPALLPAMLPAPALAADFHVTAVFGLPERLLALIERQGETKQVRAGDVVGGLRIAAVVPEGVQVEQGDGRLVLVPLGGSGAVRLPTALPPTGTIQLPPRRQAVAALRAVEQATAADPDPASVAVAVAVNEALALPAQARIAAIDDIAPDSPRAALREVRAAVAAGRIPRLRIENVPGVDEVYVAPADAGTE